LPVGTSYVFQDYYAAIHGSGLETTENKAFRAHISFSRHSRGIHRHELAGDPLHLGPQMLEK